MIPDPNRRAGPARAGGRPDPYEHRITVRYGEVDRQGVVFNAWYLAYLDDALTGWFSHIGLPYDELLAGGYDTQVVHTELDWQRGLGFGDQATITVEPAGAGRTSFTLAFVVSLGTETVLTARTVYVCVAADGSGTRQPPRQLRAALEA